MEQNFKPWNSIQNGSCCKGCFPGIVQEAHLEGNLVGLSEKFRITAGMVLQRFRDAKEGLPPDPCHEDEYVDQVIINVPDPRDPEVREVIIIAANLPTDECYCQG